MIDRFLPKSHEFWKSVTELGLKRVKESTGSDIVGMVPREGGTIEIAPMKLKEREAGEDIPTSQVWRTIGTEEEWEPGPMGISHEYIGNTPVGFFVNDPHRETSLLEARIRDAIDMGDADALYTDANIELHEEIQVLNPEGEAGGQAVADGGNVQGNVTDRYFEVETDQLPDDYLIDLDSDEAGTRVSWRRTNDILHEVVPTEEMNMQEKRGELAGAAGNEDKAMRIMIYALIAIVAVVFIFFLGPSIVNGIFGDGSFMGGVGGALPPMGGG